MRTRSVLLISAAILGVLYTAAGLSVLLLRGPSEAMAQRDFAHRVMDPQVMPPEAAFAAAPLQQATPVARQEADQLRGASVQVKDCTFTGPFTHENLSIYLIHGANQANSQGFMTLQEALDQNVATVRDTGFVLTIDNRSKSPLFIQGGDIVKGGCQDRTLPYDQIVPPETKQVTLAALCVEAGRSGPRGQEISGSFQTATQQLPGKRLKLAAMHRKSQQEVWQSVALTQANLTRNLGVPVQDPLSQTSLQLTLETPQVQQAVDRHVRELSTQPAGKNDVIGFAVAINGQLHSADIYASADLFKSLWPKLLRASAVEALAEEQSQGATAPSVQALQDFLLQAEQGQTFRQPLGAGSHAIRHETAQAVLFDTCDQGRGNLVVHRTYLAK